MTAHLTTDQTVQDSGSIPLTPETLKVAYEQLQKQNEQLQQQLDEQNGLISEKTEIIDKKSVVIGAQKKRIAILEEHIRLANHKQYGPSSEKNALQGELFNEAELLADGESDVSGEITPELDKEEESPKKRKKRKGLSPDLVREQVIHPLSDEEKQGAIDTFFVTVKDCLLYTSPSPRDS